MSGITATLVLGETLGLTVSARSSDTPPLFPTDSDEFLRFMVPVLGPTATIVAYRATRMVRERGDGFDVDTATFAAEHGLAVGQLAKAMTRLAMFGQLDVRAGWYMFYTTVNHYPVRWAERLPKGLLGELVEWQRLVVVAR